MTRNHTPIAVTSFLVATFLSAAQASSQQTSNQRTDPLIDKGGETTVYIGVFLIIIVSAMIVGMLSRRVEHTVFAALGLSLISIAFFLFISR